MACACKNKKSLKNNRTITKTSPRANGTYGSKPVSTAKRVIRRKIG